MGNACCVAAKAKTVSSITSSDDLHRHARRSPSWSSRRDNHARRSPSWSFRRDNRRVAGEIDNHMCDRTTDCRVEFKSGFGVERGTISDGETPHGNIMTPTFQKSPGCLGPVTSSLTPSDASFRSNHFAAGNNSIESSEISEAVTVNLHTSLSSPASFLASDIGPSASHGQLFPPSSSTPPCRQSCRSPGHQLIRQISDSRILSLKSPNSNSSDGRPSFVLSASTTAFAHEHSVGSQGGDGSFCDGWSLQTFSELVASSQRERLSFDSDHFDSGRYRINDESSSSHFSYSPCSDLRACGACSKLLSERAPFVGEEVVAVLVCGHAYHADCLEKITPEATRYDPCCPVCTVGEKKTAKMSKKALKAEAQVKMKFHKKLKARVMDSYFGSDLSSCELGKRGVLRGTKSCKTGASSSKMSFGKPFLKRHFSIGSRWIKAVSENDSAKKKSFWSRNR